MWLVQIGRLQTKFAHHPGKTKVFAVAEWLVAATFTLKTAGCWTAAIARAVRMRTATMSMSIFTASVAAFEASVAGRASSAASQSFACLAGTQF